MVPRGFPLARFSFARFREGRGVTSSSWRLFHPAFLDVDYVDGLFSCYSSFWCKFSWDLSLSACVFSLDFDGQMSKATESFELEKNYPLANGQVDLWVMTHALCAAGKCSVWSGGSILSGLHRSVELHARLRRVWTAV